MSFDPFRCKKCNKVKTTHGWCKPCQIDSLKNYITISKNEKIDGFIQETQLKIDSYNDIVFEWIPYNQFDEIKEINKDDFATIYSAIWSDGPLHWNYEKFTRDSNKEVALKCLHNSQNITNEFLNEV